MKNKLRRAELSIGRSWTVICTLPSYRQLVRSFGGCIACQGGPASGRNGWSFIPLSH